MLRMMHHAFACVPQLSTTRTVLYVYLFLLKESASPWPKFDKAVSELHDWLETLSEMMKTEKTVLGDSEDMEGLLEKQKVSNSGVITLLARNTILGNLKGVARGPFSFLNRAFDETHNKRNVW